MDEVIEAFAIGPPSMSNDDQLDVERILREARAKNVDPKWTRWVEDLAREVRRLRSEVDELLSRGSDPQRPDDTSIL